jgi:outer membrane protein assembly factor BamB
MELTMRYLNRSTLTLACLVAVVVTTGTTSASDWPNWRGAQVNGTSTETSLISQWSRDGENLIWRNDFTGRSTPVALHGRVCANGRAGEGINRQEMVACFDAESGERLWEYRFNVYQTTVPWTRVGWANVTGDQETGYIYAQGVGGLFHCLDSKDGRVVWSRNLIEELGFMEGYGGRTQTSAIDENRVIITFSNTSWGSQAKPLHRTFAFDKLNGELLWTSTPGTFQMDKNTQSTPSIALIDGQRLVIHGNGDGSIYALQARTGEKVWGFGLSKRGINTSVLVDGETVFAAHSEENLDEGTMGRFVAIDATGVGDVTQTHERWRVPLGVGYSSPGLLDGTLYILDNSANLHALDASTGEEHWEHSLGNVGKSSPVLADGKLYATEVNGRFHILEIHPEGATSLDVEELSLPTGRYAEIYGSPAIAYGRVYFTTEEGIYCLGDPTRAFEVAASQSRSLLEDPAPATSAPAILRVMPAEIQLGTSDEAELRTATFDVKGRSLGSPDVEWSLQGLVGEVSDGRFRPAKDRGSQAGYVVAKLGDLEAKSRVRVIAPLPLEEDFESTDVGSRPGYFLAYVGRFGVEELDGSKVLAKGPSPRKIHRHITFLGSHQDSGYTIEADVRGSQDGRKLADVGLINSGYTLDLMGNHKRLEIRSWASALRMVEKIDFEWLPNVWYRMKLRVDIDDDRALIRGKVWPKTEPEPEEWQITAADPLPIRQGSPGLYGYSPTPVYFDNVKVTSHKP